MFNKKLKERIKELEDVLMDPQAEKPYIGSELDRKLEEKDLEDIKRKLDFIADKLGYKEEESLFMVSFFNISGRSYLRQKLTKWDSLLKALNVEWKNESCKEAHFKVKPLCKKSTKRSTKKK